MGRPGRACPVRYIFNTPKEGRDCPSAYSLAPLASKASNVDVQHDAYEQNKSEFHKYRVSSYTGKLMPAPVLGTAKDTAASSTKRTQKT